MDHVWIKQAINSFSTFGLCPQMIPLRGTDCTFRAHVQLCKGSIHLCINLLYKSYMINIELICVNKVCEYMGLLDTMHCVYEYTYMSALTTYKRQMAGRVVGESLEVAKLVSSKHQLVEARSQQQCKTTVAFDNTSYPSCSYSCSIGRLLSSWCLGK